MTTATAPTLIRVLNEGYGPGAWHGADLKASLDAVTADTAFWRPGPERHNIAEIVLHHAYTVRSVRGKLTGQTPQPFALEGDDWFEAANGGTLSWPQIRAVLDDQQDALAAAVADRSENDGETFDLVLGITCHAIYHAGQVQLIKRLSARG